MTTFLCLSVCLFVSEAISKVNSVFTIEVKGIQYHLHGNQLACQAAERSAKRFKPKATIDL